MTWNQVSAGRLSIAGVTFGWDDTPPVAFSRGSCQARHGRRTARDVAAGGRHAIASDLPGHGDREWVKGDRCDQNLFPTVAVRSGHNERPAVAGASQGGITAFTATDEGRADPSCLTVVDASLGRLGPRSNGCGTEAPRTLRLRVAEGGRHNGRTIFGWQQSVSTVPGGLVKNLGLRADGRWSWHWDPELLRRPRGHQALIRHPTEEERDGVAPRSDPTPLIRGGTVMWSRTSTSLP